MARNPEMSVLPLDEADEPNDDRWWADELADVEDIEEEYQR